MYFICKYTHNTNDLKIIKYCRNINVKKYLEQNAQQIIDFLVGKHVANPYKDNTPDLSIPLGYFLRHDGEYKIHIFQRLLDGKTTSCKKIYSIIATITHFHFIRKSTKTSSTQTNPFDTQFGRQLAEQIAENITNQINELQTQITETSYFLEKESLTSIGKKASNTIEKEAPNTIEKKVSNSIEKDISDGIEKEVFNSIEKEIYNGIEKEAYNSIEKEVSDGIEMSGEQFEDHIKIAIQEALQSDSQTETGEDMSIVLPSCDNIMGISSEHKSKEFMALIKMLYIVLDRLKAVNIPHPKVEIFGEKLNILWSNNDVYFILDYNDIEIRSLFIDDSEIKKMPEDENEKISFLVEIFKTGYSTVFKPDVFVLRKSLLKELKEALKKRFLKTHKELQNK